MDPAFGFHVERWTLWGITDRTEHDARPTHRTLGRGE